MLETILALAVAAIVPAVATYLALQIAKLNALIDTIPAVFKQLLAVVVAFGFAWVSGQIGVTLPAEGLPGLEHPEALAGVLSGVVAWILHKVFHPQD